MSSMHTVVISEMTEEERVRWMEERGCAKLRKSVEENPAFSSTVAVLPSPSSTADFRQLQEELASTKEQLRQLQEKLQAFLAERGL